MIQTTSVGRNRSRGRSATDPESRPHFPALTRVLLLMLLDSLVLFVVGVAAYLLWARPVRDQPASLYLQLVALLPLFLLGYANAGLYPGFGLGPVEVLRRFSLRTSFMFLVLSGFAFGFKLPHVFSRMTFLIALVLSLCALPAFRFLIAAVLHRLEWWAEPIVVVGTGPRTERIVRDILDTVTLGYRPVAILSSDPSHLGPDTHGLPVLEKPALVHEMAPTPVTTALLAPEEGESVSALVESLQEHFQRVIMVHGTDAFPVEGVEVRNLGRALGIEFNNQSLRAWNRFLKRGLDLVLGGASFLLVLPFVALAGLVVKTITGSSALYEQEREGFAGDSIRVLKLRTMVEDAEDRLGTELASDPAAREQWERGFKLRRDPRVIPVIGPLLRRFSLDEAPQLWQVLKGELSLVGPRPFPEYHLSKFPPDFRRLRRQVRPGVTGLWQVMARGEGDLDDQRLYDAYYIRNWSVWMDLYILARTLGTVLRGRGAF